MKCSRKPRRVTHVRRRNFLHLATDDIKDAAAFSESVDAANAKRWLLLPPKAESRVRQISPREMKASGCPPGTKVIVVRGPEGCHQDV